MVEAVGIEPTSEAAQPDLLRV